MVESVIDDVVLGDVDERVGEHREEEVHDQEQPPETHGDTEHDATVPSQSDVDSKADDPHGNAAHSETFAVDGDAQPPEEHGDTEHDATVPSQSDVDSKADDPHGSESHSSEVVHEGDIEIDLIEVQSESDLPDPENLDDPTIAYVNDDDDYAGVFQE